MRWKATWVRRIPIRLRIDKKKTLWFIINSSSSGRLGSGHKRRRGSAQPSPSGVKKTKEEIDRDYREKRKGEMNELKKENKILQESKWRFLGQMDQMKMEVRERGEEIISLRIKLDRHDNSLRELEEKLTASGEEKMTALKEEHAQEKLELNTHMNEILEQNTEMKAMLERKNVECAQYAQEKLELNTRMNAILEQHREMKAMLERKNVEYAQNNSMETHNNYSDYVYFPSFYD
ncbi:hypothetical protein NC651_040522 [Populus alba x Populus x berolinensis]|nr:hypothetical protein NC651_040522 [Populus alba x Populus x berolinensis]